MAVQRVRRIVRKVDPWTVLKVALVLNTIGALIWTLGVWVAWSIAVQRGTVTDHRSGKTIPLRQYLRGDLLGLSE